MWLAVMEHLQILIRETGLECGKQMTACCHIVIDLLKQASGAAYSAGTTSRSYCAKLSVSGHRKSHSTFSLYN